jgi:DNA-binding LacI/PurR family transcriptional regulator
MRALTAAGRRVPEDVSVVGVDDVPLAAYVNPPLTTMAQPFEAIASAGLASLIAVVEDPASAGDTQVLVPTRLVLRESTAPPPTPLRPEPQQQQRRQQQD